MLTTLGLVTQTVRVRRDVSTVTEASAPFDRNRRVIHAPNDELRSQLYPQEQEFHGDDGILGPGEAEKFLKTATAAGRVQGIPASCTHSEHATHCPGRNVLTSGAPGEIRTPDLLLRRTCRTKNQQLAQSEPAGYRPL